LLANSLTYYIKKRQSSQFIRFNVWVQIRHVYLDSSKQFLRISIYKWTVRSPLVSRHPSIDR